MNGGLFQMSGIDVWMSAGGGFLWSSAFSAAMGGYPMGARVLMASGIGGYWRSIVDNNTSNPDTGGAGWVPDSGSALLVIPFSGGITFPANTFTVGSLVEVTATAASAIGTAPVVVVGHPGGGSGAVNLVDSGLSISNAPYLHFKASLMWNAPDLVSPVKLIVNAETFCGVSPSSILAELDLSVGDPFQIIGGGSVTWGPARIKIFE